ncbi:MAG: hypothetical protein GXP24_09335 [Planctomycetes bacterium]|nr:hypothetical protein [Planctomycetota bacterium]
MTKQLVVRMLVPLPYPIFFKKFWPPEELAATVSRDDLKLKLWLDKDSLSDWCPKVDSVEELHKHHSHPTVGSVHVECEILNVQDDLITHIYEFPEGGKNKSPLADPIVDPDDQRHELFGKNLYIEIRRLVNRFIEFARTNTGQFRAEHIPEQYPSTFFENAKAKISVDRGSWIKWYPPPNFRVLRVSGYKCVRNIEKSDWTLLCDFLAADGQSDLVLALLANAEALADQGYTRSAILEAVGAVEFCIGRFMESPKLATLAKVSDKPVRSDGLRSLYTKMGLRGTVDHLLPLYFSDQEMPPEILKSCQSAVASRQNIAHCGQRKVDAEKVEKYLKSIREFCSILTEYMDDTSVK